MNRLKNQILLAAGFALLAGVISGITAAPAIAAAIKAALIKNVDEPGRSPFQTTLHCGITAASNMCNANFFTVPVGKRLVIQHVSGGTLFTTGPQIRYIQFGCGAIAQVHAERESSSGGFDQASVNTPFVEYCEAGTTVSTQMALTTAVPVMVLDLSVTGYFIDLSI